jgi:hypothetical protein
MHRELCAQHELRSPGCETLCVHVSRHLHTTLAVVHNRRSGQGAPLPGADVGGDKTASGQSQTLQLVLPRHGTITQTAQHVRKTFLVVKLTASEACIASSVPSARVLFWDQRPCIVPEERWKSLSSQPGDFCYVWYGWKNPIPTPQVSCPAATQRARGTFQSHELPSSR